MMRLPAYAKPLIAARSAGREPWLVSVAIGKLRDTVLLAGVSGVSRIGWVDVLTAHEAQWSLLVGTNVMLSLFIPPANELPFDPRQRILKAIWQRGRPGTMWIAGDADARYLNVWPRAHGELDFEPSQNSFPLNAGLRADVLRHRQLCVAVGDGLFARPEFDPVRVEALAAMTAPLSHAAG